MFAELRVQVCEDLPSSQRKQGPIRRADIVGKKKTTRSAQKQFPPVAMGPCGRRDDGNHFFCFCRSMNSWPCFSIFCISSLALASSSSSSFSTFGGGADGS